MNNFLLLLVLPSIFVLLGPGLAKSSSSLDSLVGQFSQASLKGHFESFRREKRQKDSDSVRNDASQRQTAIPMGEDLGAHCLVRCLRPMINKAPQDAGNETLICPKYEPKRIEELCDGYLQARRCLDQCPESPLKNLSTSGFKPLQFMCVERSDDFKKYMPCLTSVCDEVQKQCEPTCGSLDESVRRLARIQQQVRGPGSRSRGADLDAPEIMQTVADNCQLVSCVGNCSKEPMTRRCGTEAYDLQRDTIWTMLSSMAEAVSSIGLNSVWPPQCQAILTADKQRHTKTESSNSEKGRGPNSTDRFVEKQIDRSSNTTSSQSVPSPHPHVEASPASTAIPIVSTSPKSAASSVWSSSTSLLLSSFLFVNILRPIV